MVLQVSGLTASAPDGTTLLDDVGFTVRRGWLVAVMGPPGAGKSSLLNALAGSLATDAGTIRLDGRALGAESGGNEGRIAFVPQDDVLHPQLTLGRTLAYAASLRLPPGVDATQRHERVAAVLSELGLTEHAFQPISTLSGGQRRRAGVAVELVGDPSVLVLDEPTSGLDPGAERSVLELLRGLADRGRTLLTVTHSLQALAVCDRVLFLAPGGQVAFYGPPSAASEFFRGASPADVFTRLRTQPGPSAKDRFRASPTYARYVERLGLRPSRASAGPATPGAAPRRPRRLRPLGILLRRYVDVLRADRRLVALLALQGPLLGAVLWAVLTPGSLSRPGPGSATVGLFLAVSVTWIGPAVASREIVKELRLLRQERGTGLSVGAYVGSKALLLGLLTVVQAGLLTAIAGARQAPPAAGAVLASGSTELLVGSALVGLAAVARGLALSAAVDSPDKALTLLPVVLVVQLVLSGTWVSAQDVPGIELLRSLTGAHWGSRLVDATVTGDAGGWWTGAAALVGLTAGALLAARALLRRRLRPAAVRVPWAVRSAVVLPRLAPALAALVVAGMSASSLALFEAGVDRPAGDRRPAAPAPATSAPELLEPPAGADPAATVAAPPVETTVPAAPPPAVATSGDRGAAPELIGAVTGLVGGATEPVRDLVGGVVAPVGQVVDQVLPPPTTTTTLAPTPTTAPPDPAPSPLESLLEVAWEWYLFAEAIEGAGR